MLAFVSCHVFNLFVHCDLNNIFFFFLCVFFLRYSLLSCKKYLNNSQFSCFFLIKKIEQPILFLL